MKSQKKVKITMLIVIGFILLLGLAYTLYSTIIIKKELPKPLVIDTENQPMLGNPKAAVHIVAFEDLKCVNCARFNNTIFPKIKQNYIDTGIANYTMINLAFIPGSEPAANAARCVYQQNPDLFFNYVDAIFKNQPPEDNNWATVPTLLTFSAEIKGINTDRLATCLIQGQNTAFIENNLKQASQLMNHQVSTPTIYINGILVKPLTEKQINLVIDAVK